MSSNNMNNFTPLPGARRTGVRAYDAHLFNNNNNNNSNEVPVFFRSHSNSNEVPVFYRSHSSQATDDRVSGVLDQRQLPENRTPTGFHSIIANFLSQPHGRQHLNAQNRGMGRRGFNRRLREILQQSTPRSTLQITNTQVVPSVVENSRSTALSKLKKEVYNPAPKNLARKLSSYYRDNNYKAANALKESGKEKDEDGKRCAICLEDFQPNEEVMITPCKHLFHEDCIVPWLTSKGHCPVCRFVIGERVRGNTSSFNINDIANMEPSDLIAEELLSILGALEEAFQLGNATH